MSVWTTGNEGLVWNCSDGGGGGGKLECSVVYYGGNKVGKEALMWFAM